MKTFLFRYFPLALVVLAIIGGTVLLSQASPAVAGPTQSYTANASPASPTVTFPAFDDTNGPLNTVTVTLTTTLSRSYGIIELEGDAPGIIIFNAANSFQGANLLSPLGGLVGSGRTNVAPLTVQCPPGGMVPSFVDTPITWTTTQITTVNPEEYAGPGSKTFTMQYPSEYTVIHQSGVTRARQNSLISTTVTVKYN